MKDNLRKTVITGIGIALFTVLTLCLQVPVFQNYYLCLGYIVMAVYCYSVGTVSGTIVGVLGVVLYCVLTNGLRGMPGWALGNIAIGLGMGLISRRIRGTSGKAAKYVLWTAAAVISTALGILGIKSLVDSLIRSQPFIVRVGMNIYAFIADAVVLILAYPLCAEIDKRIRRMSD